MLDANALKEEISYSYAQILATRCGFSIGRPHRDNDSVDCFITYNGKLSNLSVNSSPQINIQLKSTASPQWANNSIKYQIRKKNYDDLIARSFVSKIFVLFVMPEIKTMCCRYLNISKINGIAYWVHLCGMAPLPIGQESKLIDIPKKNKFTQKALYTMMDNISNDRGVDYGL